MQIYCEICKNKNFVKILNKNKTKIYTNREDNKKDNKKLKCILYQCKNCNFVFQKITKKLKDSLSKIYKSEFAQLSQPLGQGNWGKKRFLALKGKLDRINRYKHGSILEIGCGNGYVLKYLKKLGFKDLTGVDPSLNKSFKEKKINLLNKFVTKKLNLKKKFDFIFSIGFYEHVFNLNEITSFSLKHLNDDGEIFLVIPNFFSSLTNGNPDLFAHEHINYFTKKVMIEHFKNHSLQLTKDLTDKHSISLYLKKVTKIKKREEKIKFINYQYDKKLDKNIIKISRYLTNYNCIVHGACNSLNNILSWSKLNFQFTLVDNDEGKIGKIFYKKKVISIKSLNLEEYDYIIIIPTYFKDEIKKTYIKRGFSGKFIYLK